MLLPEIQLHTAVIGTITVLTGMTVSSLPLIALCALSSGTLRLSRSLSPAHPAGLAVDPTVEGKRDHDHTLHLLPKTLKTQKHSDTICSTPVMEYCLLYTTAEYTVLKVHIL